MVFVSLSVLCFACGVHVRLCVCVKQSFSCWVMFFRIGLITVFVTVMFCVSGVVSVFVFVFCLNCASFVLLCFLRFCCYF